MGSVISVPQGVWPAADLEAVPGCPVCGAAARTPLYPGLRDRTFRVAPGTWRLVRCGACASAFLDPRPTPASAGRAYGSYFTHGETPGAAAPPAGALARARRALADGALRPWGYPVGHPAGRILARALPARGRLAARSIRHLRRIPGGRLLDIGSGSGAFVARMRELGWEAEGLEPDPIAVGVARRAGVPVAHGGVEDLDAAGAYDAITLNHVLEHLHDPVDALARVRRALRPAGVLWIATPNLAALGHRRFRQDWLALDVPRHLVLYTPASLRRLLAGAGFAAPEVPPPAPEAWALFSRSALVAAGRPPEEGLAGPQAGVRARAWLADRIAARRPSVAEELVVLARRDPAGDAIGAGP